MSDLQVVSSIEAQLIDILDASRHLIADIKPSEWAEQNRIMTSDVSAFEGPFRYDKTPYLKEIVNCLSPYSPARIVAVKKGSQIGFTTGVIEAGIGWIISQNPGNILFLSGHSDLSEEIINTRIDQMISSCGLQHLIRPNVIRKKNQRTGDTSKAKEFPGGSLVAGSASNHKLLRQRSVRYGFVDDFDAAKKSSRESGDTTTMIKQRFAAYYDKMKLFLISTPEVKQTSNIEPAYNLGDQRMYHIPCPCCGTYIALHWSVETSTKDKAGITWTLDKNSKLIDGSVGYICQSCAGFFDDKRKHELNIAGEWRATAEPSEIGYYSYHISSLYAPLGMYDWEYYVRQYLEANPPSGKRDENKHRALVNLCWGETYEQTEASPEASAVQKNTRDYQVNEIPENISEKDGSGKIIMLTCACDLNGTEHDARLDYEIVGWAETGSRYAVRHGSIGTFIPREGTKKEKTDRLHWSYEYGRPNCVWPILEMVLSEKFKTSSGREMSILFTGVDCGHYTLHAYSFLDRTNQKVIGIKGDKEDKYRKYGIDMPVFKLSKERKDLFLIDVNKVKDDISAIIDLKWKPNSGDVQPPGFMNYPSPSQGLYLFHNYYAHYESEHRIIESKDGQNIGSRWVKKHSNDQNHFFDICCYNFALKDIWASKCLEAEGLKGHWHDFVQYLRLKKMI